MQKNILKSKFQQFKKTLYFKSLKSINSKHIFSALTDFSFIIFFWFFSLLASLFIDSIYSSLENISFASETAQMAALIPVLRKSLFIIIVFFVLMIIIYSFTRYALFSLLYKKWHGWKNFLKYSLFTLSSFIVVLLILFSSLAIFKEEIVGFFGLFVLVLYAYFMLSFNIIYFNKPDIFNSLKNCFSMGFGFLGRFLLGCLTILIFSFIIIIFKSLLDLLNVTNNLTTSMIISNVNMFLIGISLFLLMAWLRDYLIQYHFKLK